MIDSKHSHKPRKTLRHLYRAIKLFALLLALYFSSVYVLPKVIFKDKDNNSKNQQLFLFSNGSHVDIVVPLKNELWNWEEHIDQNAIVYADSTFLYIAFGWGDKEFFLNTPTWDDLTFSTAFKAAFWLGSGAVHVTYYNEIPNFVAAKQFKLSENQYKELCLYILKSFNLTEELEAIHITTNANYGNRDAFFESTLKYSLFHTCNSWVNKGLKTAKTKHCLWTALEFGVMDLFD